jgi:hypothetical protein
VISPARFRDGTERAGTLDGSKVTLSRLRPGEQFAYVFDLGDYWAHLCTAGERRVDPAQALGVVPENIDDPPHRESCLTRGDRSARSGRRVAIGEVPL